MIRETRLSPEMIIFILGTSVAPITGDVSEVGIVDAASGYESYCRLSVLFSWLLLLSNQKITAHII